MRLTKLAVILMLGILLVSGLGCGGLAKPIVNYVPDGWEFEGEYHSETSDFVSLKYVKKENGNTAGSLGITYSSIPGYITQHAAYYGVSIEEALLAYAKLNLQTSRGTDKESGTTTVGDHPAVYTQFKIPDSDITLKHIYFIEEDTFFKFSMDYRKTSVETEAMALINSITFN